MTDEPENLTLRLLREMREENASFREEVRQGFDAANKRFDRLEAESTTQSALLGKVIDAVTELARGQEQLAEMQQIHGNRLNVIDARLATIERHTGLVKA